MHNLITNKKLSKILRKEAERRRATFLPYAPTEIYIDPCNACDLRCTFCPQSNWGDRRRGVMPFELYVKAIDEVVELQPQRVNLFCYGESLLHKDIGKMIQYAVGKGLWIRIHTNAKTLDAEKAKLLLTSGLSEIRFSFDTSDRELYNRLRIRSDFDLVLGNIRRFLDIKAEMGRDLPHVYLQEMVPFVKDAQPANSEEYKKLFEGRDVIFNARFMHNFAGGSIETEFAGIQATGKSVCRELYRRLVVTFDGKVHACCLDAEGLNIIGDLSNGDTIASSWNSPAMQELRRRTGEGDVEGLDPCRHCDQIRRDRRETPTAKKVIGLTVWKVFDALSGH